MANINFLSLERIHIPDLSVEDDQIDTTADDEKESEEAFESLKNLCVYYDIQNKNLAYKIRMINKIRNNYNIGTESFKYDVALSQEGLIGGIIKIIGEAIKFIIKIFGIIIKGIFRFFVNLFIKAPIRAIDKNRVYKLHQRRMKRGRGRDSLDNSMEDGLSENGMDDKTKTNKNKIVALEDQIKHLIHVCIEKLWNTDNQNVKKLFCAIFRDKNAAIDIGSINTINHNVVNIIDIYDKELNVFESTFKQAVNNHGNKELAEQTNSRMEEQHDRVKQGMENVNKYGDMFNNVNIAKVGYKNVDDCVEACIDSFYNFEYDQKLLQTMNAASQPIGKKTEVLKGQVKKLETYGQKLEGVKSIPEKIKNMITSMAKAIGEFNKTFLAYNSINYMIYGVLKKLAV